MAPSALLVLTLMVAIEAASSSVAIGDVVTSDFGASVTSVNEASTALAAAARRSPRGCCLAAWLNRTDPAQPGRTSDGC